MKITYQQLIKVIWYEPETGEFRWVNKTKGIKPGAKPGNTMKCGYVRIYVEGRSYLAHRLAWFYMTGEWPVADIDHCNGRRNDNRWENLRDATRKINLQNSMVPRRTSSIGLRGVQRNHKRFMARISGESGRKYIGTYDTPEQAHAAYIEVKKLEHPGWIHE